MLEDVFVSDEGARKGVKSEESALEKVVECCPTILEVFRL
jgi:hypothetical protein